MTPRWQTTLFMRGLQASSAGLAGLLAGGWASNGHTMLATAAAIWGLGSAAAMEWGLHLHRRAGGWG